MGAIRRLFTWARNSQAERLKREHAAAVDLALNPRSPALRAFLTAPRSLTEDPTFCSLQDRIRKARAAHMPVKGLQQALQDYVHDCLRRGA